MNLVIGGTGFLGGEIIKQLARRGERVRVLSRQEHKVPEGVDVIQGDITDPESLKRACDGIETVYHTASLPSISLQWEPFYRTNVVGAENVVDACAAAGVRKLVYTSSASVVFNGKPQPGVDESAPYPDVWLAHYPRSKSIAEKMILDIGRGAAGARVSKGTLLTCAIRPHLIIGRRDRHLIPRLFDRAQRGKLFRVGDGTNMIDIIFIENAALGHIQAADALTGQESPVNGNAYFLSQGEPVNCWQWIDQVLEMKGLPKVKKSVSFKTAWRYGAFLETVYKLFGFKGEPTMTRFLSAQLGQTHYLNIAKAKRDFGYTPMVGMEEGMAQLAKNL